MYGSYGVIDLRINQVLHNIYTVYTNNTHRVAVTYEEGIDDSCSPLIEIHS